MTPERWAKVKEILGAALECKASDREALVDSACADDPALKSEVESLMAAYDKADDMPLQGWAAALGSLEAPASIGPYRLERELGAGGMGQVWLAEQTEPVRRQVAIKLIRAGLYDRQVMHRFLAERQSLALMNHPAIAKIFDAGATAAGQPYLVMEFVDGLPITDYCDHHQLSVTERLRLFQLVCDGVQHAHQKAIIHRDLKPSNILVTEVDGKPVPRIIDFGVAKGMARDLTVDIRFTQVGTLVGTSTSPPRTAASTSASLAGPRPSLWRMRRCVPAHRGQFWAAVTAVPQIAHTTLAHGALLIVLSPKNMSSQWGTMDGPECTPAPLLDPHSGAMRTDTARVLDPSQFEDRPRRPERAPAVVSQVGNPGVPHQQAQTALCPTQALAAYYSTKPAKAPVIHTVCSRRVDVRE